MDEKQQTQKLAADFLSIYSAENIPNEHMLTQMTVEEYFASEGDKIKTSDDAASNWEALRFTPDSSFAEPVIALVSKIIIPLIADLVAKKSLFQKKEKNWDEEVKGAIELVATKRLGEKSARKLARAFIKWVKEHPELLIP
jgi:hypothetical protein